MVEVEYMCFSSPKDKNHVMAYRPYFGITKEIWQIDYVTFKCTLFKFKWINMNTGVQTMNQDSH